MRWLLVRVHPADQRGRAMGIMAGGFAAGAITGPAVGGVLFERMGYGLPFVLIFLSAVILALVSAKALPEGYTSREKQNSFRALLTRPQVRLLVLCAALSMSVLGMLEAVVPLHLQRGFRNGSNCNRLDIRRRCSWSRASFSASRDRGRLQGDSFHDARWPDSARRYDGRCFRGRIDACDSDFPVCSRPCECLRAHSYPV